jgi:hypothetical protein
MNFEKLLSTQKLVQQSPDAGDIASRGQQILPDPLKVFYGETFDDKGNTIDSMKYYLFVSSLGDALKEKGINVDPIILVADSAACRNAVGHETQMMELGNDRFNFVHKVNEIYGANLRIIKMSEYIDTSSFIGERKKIMDICENNVELMDAVRESVPDSKRDLEKSKGYLYSFDEITSIINLDIKVGPPREDLYDNIARKIAAQRDEKQVMSLFLSPTFPLGMGWSYFFVNEGIEEHGITAYKAGSKRLQRNRIIVGNSDPEYVKSLLENSFISTNPNLPNPVLDIGLICELARKKIDGDKSDITLADEFYTGQISSSELKTKVSHDVNKFILSKFK